MKSVHLSRLFRGKRQFARRAQAGEVFLILRRRQTTAYLVLSEAEDALQGIQYKGRVWNYRGAALFLLDYPLCWSGAAEATGDGAQLPIPPAALKVILAQGTRLPCDARYVAVNEGEGLLRLADVVSQAA